MSRRIQVCLMLALALPGLLVLSGCGRGPAQEPAIQIDQVWARPTKPTEMGSTSAVYMTANNRGSSADALLSAATDVAELVELHETRMQNHVMQMQKVDRIEMPAGAVTELKPGGLHIMLIRVKRDLKPGDSFSLTLTFAQQGEMIVSVTVKEPQ